MRYLIIPLIFVSCLPQPDKSQVFYKAGMALADSSEKYLNMYEVTHNPSDHDKALFYHDSAKFYLDSAKYYYKP